MMPAAGVAAWTVSRIQLSHPARLSALIERVLLCVCVCV